MTKNTKELHKQYTEYAAVLKKIRMCRLSLEFVKDSSDDEAVGFYECKLKDYEIERKKMMAEMMQDFELTMDEKLETILVLRYIKQLTWAEIGNVVGHEPHYVMRLRNQAVEKIVEMRN